VRPTGQRSTKIPRNAPCPCGGGKKFKHCHGVIAQRPKVSETMQEQVTEMFRKMQAKEMVRKRQQGQGKPVMSATINGTRVVIVGSTVRYSQKWKFFNDFLLDYLKDTLGRQWGTDAQANGIAHPVFRWLAKLGIIQKEVGDRSKGVKATGVLSSIFDFSYALYLMEHNDQIPKGFVARLRNIEHFDAALYETIVAAAFALSGAKIEDAQSKLDGKKNPEFWATAASGRRYAVEAKRKMAWKNPYDLHSEGFRMELRSWIRNMLYKASEKKLPNAVYWFELSIGSPIQRKDLLVLHELIRSYVREAENMTIGKEFKEPPVPAYVFVTNHAYFANDDIEKSGRVCILEGFRINDLQTENPIDLETAMEQRDRHRDIIWVYESFNQMGHVRPTFNGTPAELFESDGLPQIGDPIAFTRPDGTEAVGKIRDVASMGNEVVLAVDDDATHTRCILRMPMSDDEAKAVSIYGNAVFGKPEGPSKNYDGDILGLYDRFLEMYADYPRDSLLREVEGHPNYEHMAILDNQALRVRVVRELIKRIEWTSGRNEHE
jgi:hypothetical protein